MDLVDVIYDLVIEEGLADENCDNEVTNTRKVSENWTLF